IGTPWQKWEILVATVDEFIYKVQAGRIISADDQANLGEILSLLAFCKSVYGEPANGKNGIYVWDTSEGNIVLHIEKLQRLQLGVTITATSKNTVFFERLSSGQRHHDPLGPAPVTPAQRPRLNAVEHYLRQTELHAGPEKPESDGAFAFAAKFIFNLAVGLFFAYAAGRFIGLFWPLWGYPVTLMLAAFWILSSARRLRERWAGKI
ncbi:MAG TPA: hypothetical protein VG733_18865, partial [Chthoniobacteraceae bacterium]|nr:hypothetical protein [Chthoniobacteraceae bacterium]